MRTEEEVVGVWFNGKIIKDDVVRLGQFIIFVSK